MRTLILIVCTLVSLQARSQQQLTGTAKHTTLYETEKDKVFTLADRMASFPGGINSWTKYVQKNVDFSIPVKNNAPPGKYNVIVTFIIDQQGKVSDINSLTKHGYGMEDEVIRIIEKGPRWSPALEKGKAVRSYRKQPLFFIVRSN